MECSKIFIQFNKVLILFINFILQIPLLLRVSCLYLGYVPHAIGNAKKTKKTKILNNKKCE